jgi:hypothetical protein
VRSVAVRYASAAATTKVKRGPRVRVVVPGDPVEYEPLKQAASGSSGDEIVRA